MADKVRSSQEQACPTGTDLLRHFLAALAYRTQKALRDAPPAFGEYRAAEGVRTPRELLAHMSDVLGYALGRLAGERPRAEPLGSLEAEAERFHATLERLSGRLASGPAPDRETAERLLQGPLADAMTHAGQLALLRRLAGRPVPPESFYEADVRASNVGPDQPSPRAPKGG